MTSGPNDPAVTLARWREVAGKPPPDMADREHWIITDADAEFIATARTAMPLLLGAVIAVLEDHRPGRIVIYGSLCRHHENHRYFSITSTEADGVRACPDCTATVYASCTGCGPQVSADACPVRSAIGRELAGKDSSDEK